MIRLLNAGSIQEREDVARHGAALTGTRRGGHTVVGTTSQILAGDGSVLAGADLISRARLPSRTPVFRE